MITHDQSPELEPFHFTQNVVETSEDSDDEANENNDEIGMAEDMDMENDEYEDASDLSDEFWPDDHDIMENIENVGLHFHSPPSNVFQLTLYYEILPTAANQHSGLLKISVGTTNVAQPTIPRQPQTAGVLTGRNPAMFHAVSANRAREEAIAATGSRARLDMIGVMGSTGPLKTTIGSLANFNTSIWSIVTPHDHRQRQALKLTGHLVRAENETVPVYPNGSSLNHVQEVLLQKIVITGRFVQSLLLAGFASAETAIEFQDLIGRCIMTLVWECVLDSSESTATALRIFEEFVQVRILNNLRREDTATTSRFESLKWMRRIHKTMER